MPEWFWVVIAGAVVTVLSPYLKRGFQWVVTTYSDARAEALASHLAPYLVEAFDRRINKSLEEALKPIRSDLAYVKRELTVNGGETVKDRIFSIERQLEHLITDH